MREKRVKFADAVSEPADSTAEGKASSTEGTLLIGDKKLPWWFRGQFFSQMSSIDDSIEDSKYAAAVAAAAYAISSLDSGILDQREPPSQPAKASLTTTKSKRWDAVPVMAESRDTTKRYTDEAMTKNSSMGDTNSDVNEIVSNKPVRPVTSMRRKISFADRLLDDTKSTEPQSTEAVKPILRPASNLPPVPPRPPEHEPVFKQETKVPEIQESKIDAWERDEMARIKQRSDRLSETIVEWEDEKKKKAKRRLHRKESELERVRANALRYYQADMERINQVAQGAREQAKEKQRNEELKVKEKADKYRTTGELPKTCLCF